MPSSSTVWRHARRFWLFLCFSLGSTQCAEEPHADVFAGGLNAYAGLECWWGWQNCWNVQIVRIETARFDNGSSSTISPPEGSFSDPDGLLLLKTFSLSFRNFQLVTALTNVKPVNKTDAMTLLQNYGSLAKMIISSEENLSMCSGLGPRKAKRLTAVFNEPFLKKWNGFERDHFTGQKSSVVTFYLTFCYCLLLPYIPLVNSSVYHIRKNAVYNKSEAMMSEFRFDRRG